METVLYEERFGQVRWPDGFEKELEGKTIEEQLHCYAIVWKFTNRMSYHMIYPEYYRKYGCGLLVREKFDQVIVRDGLVVGVIRNGKPFLANSLWNYEYYSDNNGSGYKESASHSYLICIPYDMKRNVIKEAPFGAPAHTFSIPITECDKEVTYPEGFLEQIKGKSIGEQADCFRITTGWEKAPNLSDENYQLNWMQGNYGTLLRYDGSLTEILVKDGVIVGVKFMICNREFDFKEEVTLYVNEEYHIFKMKEDCDSQRIWSEDYSLTPTLYK